MGLDDKTEEDLLKDDVKMLQKSQQGLQKRIAELFKAVAQGQSDKVTELKIKKLQGQAKKLRSLIQRVLKDNVNYLKSFAIGSGANTDIQTELIGIVGFYKSLPPILASGAEKATLTGDLQEGGWQIDRWINNLDASMAVAQGFSTAGDVATLVIGGSGLIAKHGAKKGGAILAAMMGAGMLAGPLMERGMQNITNWDDTGIARGLLNGGMKFLALWGGVKSLNTNKNVIPNFKKHHTHQGFSGVTDKTTGQVIMRPSVPQNPPKGWVHRGQGHATLREEMIQSSGASAENIQAFTLFLKESRAFSVEFFSRGVNNGTLPASQHAGVLRNISSAVNQGSSANTALGASSSAISSSNISNAINN